MSSIPLRSDPPISVLLHPDAGPEFVPVKAKPSDAGWDVRAFIETPIRLGALERVAVPVGFRLAIPEGYEVQVRPKSGRFLREGLTVGNTPGTIDAGFQGDVKVLLVNLSPKVVVIEPGQKIAQLVSAKLATNNIADFGQRKFVKLSKRGSGGFGSTGL